MSIVMFSIWQNNKNYLICLVLVKLLHLLNYFTWIFGVHFPGILLRVKYFLTIVDDYSRYTRVILLKPKGEVNSYVHNFIVFVENEFNKKVKCIRSDKGPEFFSKDLFSSKGNLDQIIYVATSQQNGCVERKHQHIFNVARALLFQSHILNYFWSNAIRHTVFLINLVHLL